jgi:glycine hydroxymethyltransferase
MLLNSIDSEMFSLIKEEEKRQKNSLNLIASECYAHEATLEVQASILSNKLAEGYIGERACSGCEVMDKIENLAIDRAKALFKADHANVQCPTASQANFAVYTALLKPGDVVLAPSVRHGGHFTHGSSLHISGKIYNFFHYGVSPKTEKFNYNEIRKIALEKKPKLIIAGMSAYPRIIDFQEFRKIADEIGSFLLADIAHVIGLIIAQLHPDPIPYADVVTSSTHKTLGGPRGGGLILCKEKLGQSIDQAVFPGTQGAPLMNIIASRAVLFKLAMSKQFRRLQTQIVKNAKALALELKSHGLRLVTNGTDNHLILVDLRSHGITGKEAEELLNSVGIISNRNLIPFDDKPANITSGLRLGTVPLTIRGMKEEEMRIVGKLLSNVLLKPKEPSSLKNAKKEVISIIESFPELHIQNSNN